MLRGRLLFPLLVAVAAVFVACGGRGSTPDAPTPSPNPGPTSVPVGPTPQDIVLTGGGYTLTFNVPPIVTGTTSTMSAVLQTTLPSGTKAPQSAKRGYTAVRPLSSTMFSGLVYLVVSTADSVGFSSAPSFQYTLPAGTTIPSGSHTYLLFWDPYESGTAGWINLLGPGTVSGQNVTFPSVQTGVQFAADTPYVFALAETTQSPATASPAPSPTPTTGPSPASTPSYCPSYLPSTAAGAQPVLFTNDSDTGPNVQIYLYVTAGTTQFLAANGTMQSFSSGSPAPALPLECFPGSLNGGNGKTFALPVVQAGRLWIALATPVPPGDSAPANPLPLLASGSGFSQPAPGWSGPNTPPWDIIEFSLPGGVTDVSQVNKVGLPLDVKQGGDEIGFGKGQYETLLSQILAAGFPYSNLAVPTSVGSKSVLGAIFAPQEGGSLGFPQDWFYSSHSNTSPYAAQSDGYIGYVLSQYQQHPQVYEVLKSIGDKAITADKIYCASADKTGDVLFYNVASPAPSPCPTSFSGPPSYTMPIYNTLEGTVTSSGASQYNGSFCVTGVLSMPYASSATSGGTLADQYEFYLWKAMVIDLARGVALQTAHGPHPVGGWGTATPPPLPFGDYYQDPVYNVYAKLVHENMLGNNTYAMPYDEPGGYAPTFNANSDPLQVTIRHIPAYSATPNPGATGLTCPTS